MSILADLRVAYDELDAARTEFDKPMPVSDVEFYKRKDRLQLATSNVQKLAPTSTIRALLDVAEAAEHEPRCPFCSVFRNMRGVERKPHLADCPLAPLVKEADHE